MADDNEDQIGPGDEAADNYGTIYDPGMEQNHQVLGCLGPASYEAQDRGGRAFAAAFRDQAVAQRGFAYEGMRASLAAALLQGWAGNNSSPGEWSDVAAKALGAAAIIYPDIKEPT